MTDDGSTLFSGTSFSMLSNNLRNGRTSGNVLIDGLLSAFFIYVCGCLWSDAQATNACVLPLSSQCCRLLELPSFVESGRN